MILVFQKLQKNENIANAPNNAQDTPRTTTESRRADQEHHIDAQTSKQHSIW